MGRNLKILLGLLLVLLLESTATAQIYRFRSGLHLSDERRFSEKDLQLLQKRLSFATGFTELAFDRQGTLNLGQREFSAGSSSARRLIEAVVDSEDSFTLESVSNSGSIAFAQIEATLDFFDTAGKKRQAWHIRLDLADFEKLRASEQTLESFSPVMVLFHELGHGQLKLRDPLDRLDLLGECETYVNRIRAELRLPLRESYVPASRQAFSIERSTRVEQAEFRFVSLLEQSKVRSQLLTFELEKVCAVCRATSLETSLGVLF